MFGSVVKLAADFPKGSKERRALLRTAGKMKARLMEVWEALVEMVPSLPEELGDSYAESIAVSHVMKAYPREFSTNELYDVLDYMRRAPKSMRRVADKLNIDKAIKRPGRLHKYFGIPEDEKIPMAKIDGEIKKLKDKEDKSKEEDSLLDALYLGKRLKKMGAMTDRQRLIRVAADLPKGSEERKATLAGLQKTSSQFQYSWDKELKSIIDKLKLWRSASMKSAKAFEDTLRKHGDRQGLGRTGPSDLTLQEWVDGGAPMDQVLDAIINAGIYPDQQYEAFMASLHWPRRAKDLNAAIRNLEELQW